MRGINIGKSDVRLNKKDITKSLDKMAELFVTTYPDIMMKNISISNEFCDILADGYASKIIKLYLRLKIETLISKQYGIDCNLTLDYRVSSHCIILYATLL